jgi:hypothetical protein
MALFTCSEKKLEIISIELCENFNSNGKCIQELKEKQEYILQLKKERKFDTWLDLSNYLYFHGKQTPGFIIRFNRNFNLQERNHFKDFYHSSYEFYGAIGKMEGFEMGENWIGSFNYLGAILKDRQRKFKEDKNLPYLETVFPNLLKMKYNSDFFSGEIYTEINLKIKYED